MPEDENILVSTNKGIPIVLTEDSGAAGAFKRIARRIEGENVPISPTGEYEEGFMARVRKLFGINRKEPERV